MQILETHNIIAIYLLVVKMEYPSSVEVDDRSELDYPYGLSWEAIGDYNGDIHMDYRITGLLQTGTSEKDHVYFSSYYFGGEDDSLPDNFNLSLAKDVYGVSLVDRVREDGYDSIPYITLDTIHQNTKYFGNKQADINSIVGKLDVIANPKIYSVAPIFGWESEESRILRENPGLLDISSDEPDVIAFFKHPDNDLSKKSIEYLIQIGENGITSIIDFENPVIVSNGTNELGFLNTLMDVSNSPKSINITSEAKMDIDVYALTTNSACYQVHLPLDHSEVSNLTAAYFESVNPNQRRTIEVSRDIQYDEETNQYSIPIGVEGLNEYSSTTYDYVSEKQPKVWDFGLISFPFGEETISRYRPSKFESFVYDVNTLSSEYPDITKSLFKLGLVRIGDQITRQSEYLDYSDNGVIDNYFVYLRLDGQGDKGEYSAYAIREFNDLPNLPTYYSSHFDSPIEGLYETMLQHSQQLESIIFGASMIVDAANNKHINIFELNYGSEFYLDKSEEFPEFGVNPANLWFFGFNYDFLFPIDGTNLSPSALSVLEKNKVDKTLLNYPNEDFLGVLVNSYNDILERVNRR